MPCGLVFKEGLEEEHSRGRGEGGQIASTEPQGRNEYRVCKRRIRDQIGELSLESNGWDLLDHENTLGKSQTCHGM